MFNTNILGKLALEKLDLITQNVPVAVQYFFDRGKEVNTRVDHCGGEKRDDIIVHLKIS
jgi:hypothetical protein